MDKYSYDINIRVGDIINFDLDSSHLNSMELYTVHCVRNFYDTITRIKPYYNFDNLNRNIIDLNVTLLDASNDFAGAYDYMDNKICLVSSDIEGAIYHELFHMASSNRYNNKCGFLDSDYYFGLNEGYTDLMAERYFEEYGFYEVEKDIAFLLERIVGNRKMESFYYNSDIDGVILELENYSSLADILLFLSNFDYISYIEEDGVKDMDSFCEISSFLIKCFYNKESKLLSSGKINYDRFIHELSVFVVMFKKYDILGDLELNNILSLLFDDNLNSKCLSLSKKM